MQEEGRLLYVAATRAKSELYLSLAMERWHYGRAQAQESSRYVNHIADELAKGRLGQHHVRWLSPKPQPQSRGGWEQDDQW